MRFLTYKDLGHLFVNPSLVYCSECGAAVAFRLRDKHTHPEPPREGTLQRWFG